MDLFIEELFPSVIIKVKINQKMTKFGKDLDYSLKNLQNIFDYSIVHFMTREETTNRGLFSRTITTFSVFSPLQRLIRLSN